MTDTNFELPESVFRCLTERKIRAGVDSVLQSGTKKLPSGLEWEELPQYYEAVLAACRVQVDWVLAQEQLWRSVWPSKPLGWAPVSVEEQSVGEYDGFVSIDNCWSEKWFGRYFTRPSAHVGPKRRSAAAVDVLLLSVSITQAGVSIGVSLSPETSSSGPPDFQYNYEAASWETSEQQISEQQLDLEGLRRSASEALAWVETAYP